MQDGNISTQLPEVEAAIAGNLCKNTRTRGVGKLQGERRSRREASEVSDSDSEPEAGLLERLSSCCRRRSVLAAVGEGTSGRLGKGVDRGDGDGEVAASCAGAKAGLLRRVRESRRTRRL